MLAVPICGWGQLRSVGEVPADLKMTVEELYNADLQRAKKYAGGRVKNRQLVLESSYSINKMMASGRIVYGDPLSRLAERIADTLLRDYPELRSELRFYTVNSPEVNAFATGQGMVLVNVGLVAQVENEAQLAFILSHEIIHYYRSHSMEKIVTSNRKHTRNAELEDEDAGVEDFMRLHSRSREMESESDSMGIALFYLRSPYDKEVSEGVFDVLQYSELPFDDVPFDTTFFNTRYFTLTGCWSDTIANITSRDNYDDSRSTHPNLLTRRRQCASLLAGLTGGSKYVVTTQSEFEALRHTARLECIRQELIHGQYARAFYNAWLLQKANPGANRKVLDAAMAYALYGVAMHKSYKTRVEENLDPAEIQGESQQVYHAFSTLTADQATQVALHAVWQMHLTYPDLPQFEAMADELTDLLRLTHKKSVVDFALEPPAAPQPEAAAPDTTTATDQHMSKYERIKQKRKTQVERSVTGYSLTDLMEDDSTFRSRFVTRLNGLAPKQQDEDTTSGGVLVFNPIYLVVNSQNEELKVLESVRREEDLANRMASVSRGFGQAAGDFSDRGLHQMTTDTQYADFMTMCEWMSEFWLSKGEFPIHRMMQPATDEMLDRYGARTVSLTAVLNLENQPPEVTPGYIFFLPILPVAVVGMTTGLETTAFEAWQVDMRRGKVLSRQSYALNTPDYGATIDAMLYDTYAQAMKPLGSKKPTGYMGNHLALMGGVNLGFPGYQPLGKGHYLALTPWASLEVAVSRAFTLGLTARHLHAYDDVTRTEWGGGVYPNSRAMWYFGLDVHSYMQTQFAPMGLYVNFGPHMVHFLEGADGGEAANTYGLHVGIGRNFILYRRLVLNYEVDYGYTYGLSKYGLSDDSDVHKYYVDALLANILTIRFGIGVLPF